MSEELWTHSWLKLINKLKKSQVIPLERKCSNCRYMTKKGCVGLQPLSPTFTFCSNNELWEPIKKHTLKKNNK